MAEDDDAWVQLVTRVPQRLHREAKMQAIASDRTLTTFIVEALQAKLEAAGARSAAGGSQS